MAHTHFIDITIEVLGKWPVHSKMDNLLIVIVKQVTCMDKYNMYNVRKTKL